jgi:hypothetical protein
MMRHQPCFSHSRSCLVYVWQKFEESPISPLRMSPFLFSLLISTWGPPGFGLWLMYAHYPSRKSSYQNSGFPYLYSYLGTIVGSCTYNQTIYSVCFHDGQYICFNPICGPQVQWLEVRSLTSSGKFINCTWVVNDPKKPVSTYFDVCAAIAENTGPWGNCGD